MVGNFPLPWWGWAFRGRTWARRVSRTLARCSSLLRFWSIIRLAGQGNTTVTVEPVSAYYRDSINMMNVRLDKVFQLDARQRLTGIFELFNVFNTAAVIGTNSVTGRTTDRNGVNVPSFGRATQIVNPVVFRLAVRYDF